MELTVGDMVRTAEGFKGEIVVLTKDGNSAYVQTIGDETLSRIYTYRLHELARADKSWNEPPASLPDPRPVQPGDHSQYDG